VDEEAKRLLKQLEDKIAKLTVSMEKMKLAEYVELLERPYKLLYINVLTGIARGVGIAVGFTLLGAVLIIFLQRLVMLNLPVIGEFIAEVVKIVQAHLGAGP